MKKKEITFFDLAENSYRYFMQSYKSGMCFNDMTVNAANTVEKYLKHIAMLSENKTVGTMPSWAKDHNVNKLLSELKRRGVVNCNNSTSKVILSVKTYLYCARYPEYDDSRLVNKNDMDICKRALVVCRNLTLDYIRDYEAKKELQVDDVERD